MIHLSNSEYARLRYWRSFAWFIFGLAWMWGWVMTLLWQSEHMTAMRLRGHLVEVIELQTTWGVE